MSDADFSRNQPAEEHPTGTSDVWQLILDRLREVATPRFEVERLIGYGGMAGVYLAREPKLGRKVAIKVMSPSLMMDPALVSRFRQEARTIAQLDHPNIVTIYDVTEGEDLQYFVMAYLPGRTVGHVMKEVGGPLPIQVVRAWMYQIGSALDYAHEFGVVHRDIKPGNILLDASGNALVTDFGIAKVADQEGLTRTGILVGTPAYMSPEQCSSSEIGPPSDQYALGALSYQMLTGEPPFSGPTLAVLQAHVSQAPEPLESVRPDCPPEIAAAVGRMLAKDPGERWPSLGAALSAMGALPVAHDDPVRSTLVALASEERAASVSIGDVETGGSGGRGRASAPGGAPARSPVPAETGAPGEGERHDAGPGRRAPERPRRLALLAASGALAGVLVLAAALFARFGDGNGSGDGGAVGGGPPSAAGPAGVQATDPGELGVGAAQNEAVGDEGADAPGGAPVPGPTDGPVAVGQGGALPDGEETGAPEQPQEADPVQPEEEVDVGGEPEPAPAAPEPGGVRVTGVPPGSRAVLLVAGSEVPLPPDEELSLPPGTYEGVVSAEGYEPLRERITIAAGERLEWRPALQPEPEAPAEAEEPEPDAEAVREGAAREIRAVLESFSSSFETRRMDEVLRFFPAAPGEWATQWRPLVEDTQNARGLRAEVTELGAPEFESDDRAAIDFVIRIEYRDFRNTLQNPALSFRGILERRGAGWFFSELREGS